MHEKSLFNFDLDFSASLFIAGQGVITKRIITAQLFFDLSVDILKTLLPAVFKGCAAGFARKYIEIFPVNRPVLLAGNVYIGLAIRSRLEDLLGAAQAQGITPAKTILLTETIDSGRSG
jgi:hypothetical protein